MQIFNSQLDTLSIKSHKFIVNVINIVNKETKRWRRLKYNSLKSQAYEKMSLQGLSLIISILNSIDKIVKFIIIMFTSDSISNQRIFVAISRMNYMNCILKHKIHHNQCAIHSELSYELQAYRKRTSLSPKIWCISTAATIPASEHQ